jgi:hypothetical protein
MPPRLGEHDRESRFTEHDSNDRDAITNERSAADASYGTGGREVGRDGNRDMA